MSLTVKNVSFAYRGFQALRAVNFHLEQGNLVCVLGKNGAGKSTLFKCILRVLSQYSGTISLDGKDTGSFTIGDMAKKAAYIPQSHYSVYNYPVPDIILMGTTASLSWYADPGDVQKKRVEEAMELVGIMELKERTFDHISGGEQQLVLIARAIAQQAKILIMDEPCASLDYGNQVRIMELLQQLAAKGYLIVLATHSPEHALLYADQALVMLDGRIYCQGDPQNVLTGEVLKKIYGISVRLYDIGWNDRKICVPILNR